MTELQFENSWKVTLVSREALTPSVFRLPPQFIDLIDNQVFLRKSLYQPDSFSEHDTWRIDQHTSWWAHFRVIVIRKFPENEGVNNLSLVQLLFNTIYTALKSILHSLPLVRPVSIDFGINEWWVNLYPQQQTPTFIWSSWAFLYHQTESLC